MTIYKAERKQKEDQAKEKDVEEKEAQGNWNTMSQESVPVVSIKAVQHHHAGGQKPIVCVALSFNLRGDMMVL